ncbi:hypothetical protein ABR738_16000 [Streptomyces sp. Edi4]|uniref:hypothetical protein n=1 Tax=Streptomyces sp. Edi4 TaxID=3162527 RepID=UPI003306659C
MFEKQSSAYCALFVDDYAAFIVSVERRNSGRGSDWNGYARKNGTPVRAGDEGFVWDRGAGAVFLCERPDLPRGPALPPSQKYVELELSADRAPRTPRSREILTSLLQRYAEFARRALKCRNT